MTKAQTSLQSTNLKRNQAIKTNRNQYQDICIVRNRVQNSHVTVGPGVHMLTQKYLVISKSVSLFSNGNQEGSTEFSAYMYAFRSVCSLARA